MPLTALAEQELLGYEFGRTDPPIPTNHYIGLISAGTWAPTTSYTSLGTYIVPIEFNSLTGYLGRLFKLTQVGESGGTEPIWPSSAGSTIADGGAIWTEVSTLFFNGDFAGAEPSDGGYERSLVPNTTTTWPVPTGGGPASTYNNQAISWPPTAATWGQLVGFVGFDALTSGNARWWGFMTSAAGVAEGIGVAPQFGTGQLIPTAA